MKGDQEINLGFSALTTPVMEFVSFATHHGRELLGNVVLNKSATVGAEQVVPPDYRLHRNARLCRQQSDIQ